MLRLKSSLVSALTLNYMRYYNNITASIKYTMDTMSSKFVVTRVAENSCPSFHSELTPTNFTFMHLTISSSPHSPRLRYDNIVVRVCYTGVCILRKLRFCLPLYDGCIV